MVILLYDYNGLFHTIGQENYVICHQLLLLFKTKKLNQLKKKRVKEEEENIYEVGLE